MSASQQQEILVRAANSLEELDACVQLQQSVWQFQDVDLIPRRMFVVARAVGGQVFGAWDGNALVGYALAIPGIRNARPYLHSHMLAVAPAYRNRGIGRKLKLAQRTDAIARGIDLIEWTFDPLQIKNAYLNIEKLGVIVRRYTPDFYGVTSSPLHFSLPTDRLHAEWWLRSPRVESLLAGGSLPEYPIKETVCVTYNGLPPDDTLQPTQEQALETLLRIRSQLVAAFSKGSLVLRLHGKQGEPACYQLGVLSESEARFYGSLT
jgi:predicted GNAT superfamily acetyltransferase